MRDVHVVVPDGIDDPARPSGGNTYDRHLISELGTQGWSTHERPVAGFWDRPGASSFAALEETLRQIPDGAVVLIDGLIASAAPEVVVPAASRLRLIVLVHMALGHRPIDSPADERERTPHMPLAGRAPDAATRERERAVLEAVAATVTTSAWARRRLIELYDLPTDRVLVAEPGTEVADVATGTEAGDALLCVGAVTSAKGHDILLKALESIAHLPWHCTCVGNLDRDPEFVEGLRRRALDRGLDERVSFVGPLTGADLDRAYASADLLVHASRAETYGLVVTEALARGLPVIASDVGGVTEALGESPDGTRPGLLVAPEDPAALAAALSAWLGDYELRRRLRRAAGKRRESLPTWSTTASIVSGVLNEATK